MKLPSKKILIFLAIAIVILILVFTFTRGKKNSVSLVQNTQNNKILNEIQKMTLVLAGKDSDNDGLKDWEESLWKTDPNLSDTDGDGTTDGKEVLQGRNPMKPGPNDKLEEFNPATATSTKKFKDITETDKFSQEFFARYMELKQNGDINEQDQADLISLFAEKNYSLMPNKIYTEKDLKILDDESPSALHSYGNSVVKIITENTPKKTDNELLILEKALKSNNPEEVKKYDIIIKSYKKMISGLLGVFVPISEDAVEIHISLLNSISSIISNIEAMKKVFDDPILATSNITSFINNSNAFLTSWFGLQVYFKNENIIFNKDEYGYVFMRGI